MKRSKTAGSTGHRECSQVQKSRADLEMYWCRGAVRWQGKWGGGEGRTEGKRKQRRTFKDVDPRKVPVKAYKSAQMTQIWPQIQKRQRHRCTSDSNVMVKNYSQVPPENARGEVMKAGRKVADGVMVGRELGLSKLSRQWRTSFPEALNDLLKWGEADRGQPGGLWLTVERTEDRLYYS